MQQESYFIPLQDHSQLHLKRIYQNPLGVPVFLLHGAIENGKIFYSKSMKGLAPYLARHGYDVYIGDLRGRGLSNPAINRKSKFGQTESITEDIPAFINKIIELRGECKQHWLAHSWGGVLLSAYFARFKQHRHLVNSMVYFAAKRRVHVVNVARFFYVDLMWQVISPILAEIFGYLPAKKFRMGSDNETKKSLAASINWVNNKDWQDEDGYDYGKAILQLQLPPIWYFAGINDKALGHPLDVFALMLESGTNNAKFTLLAKSRGNLHNYGHIDIVTHRDAEKDHFPSVLCWLKEHEK